VCLQAHGSKTRILNTKQTVTDTGYHNDIAFDKRLSFKSVFIKLAMNFPVECSATLAD